MDTLLRIDTHRVLAIQASNIYIFYDCIIYSDMARRRLADQPTNTSPASIMA
jgi:hypothetical protein